MRKEGSKSFRDRIRKSAELHLEGNDGTRKRSESEILAMYYSEQDIARGEKRIEKRIAKNRKEHEKQGKTYPEAEDSEREYYYVRKIIEDGGRVNYLGITKDEYSNPNFLGYKAKMMVSKLVSHGIQVEHHGDYTDREKNILIGLSRNQKNLKEMQDIFRDEDDAER